MTRKTRAPDLIHSTTVRPRRCSPSASYAGAQLPNGPGEGCGTVTDVPGPWPLGTDAGTGVAAMETSTTSTASAIATTATGDRRCCSRTGRLTGTSVVTAMVTALPFEDNYSDGFTVSEGTSKIQRMIIGRAVTGLTCANKRWSWRWCESFAGPRHLRARPGPGGRRLAPLQVLWG